MVASVVFTSATVLSELAPSTKDDVIHQHQHSHHYIMSHPRTGEQRDVKNAAEGKCEGRLPKRLQQGSPGSADHLSGDSVNCPTPPPPRSCPRLALIFPNPKP